MTRIDTGALTRRRATDPGAVDGAWGARRRSVRPADGKLMIIAADHPARGALGVRGNATAMASRAELLERLAVALSRPGVDGVLGTADILEDLLLAGLLEGKMVIGSMNRGGLQGAEFEFDDRWTGYDADTLATNGLDGGKMLTRICLEDEDTARVLESTGRAVTALSRKGLMAMVEPFLSVRVAPDQVRNQLDADSVIKSIQIAAGLGATSAYTWLKLPVVAQMHRVLDSTTLPSLLLGGDPSGDPDETYRQWGEALTHPTAMGLVIGRALLYPSGGDVAQAVDAAVGLVHRGVA
ncbi:MAG TPA: deoxyribose-phosphate aldolase [Propionicimonas sp.]|nr:deoxyribose-phosphate aldolase [Propionicimonas sp.]HRA06588.1 deoxyribose-phosphate aldolase [Propionicimonas sp.]